MEGLPVSSSDRDQGEIWLGLLHGPEAWCKVGVHVGHHHHRVTMRAFADNQSLGYIRWRYEDLIDDQVEVGPQRQDEYGLTYSDMVRVFNGTYEMVAWVRRMIDCALLVGMEFSARRGFDFSPDGRDMAWHFGRGAEAVAS